MISENKFVLVADEKSCRSVFLLVLIFCLKFQELISDEFALFADKSGDTDRFFFAV